MIRAIIFDFAGVIGTDGYKEWEMELGKHDDVGKGERQQLNDDVDRGKLSIAQFVIRMAQAMGVEHHRVKKEIVGRIIINDSLVSYIQKLKRVYKIGLLSNYHHEWLENILSEHALLPLFDAIYISSRYGMVKPEEGAFRKTLAFLNVASDEAVFVDDRQVHVDAANSYGLHGVLYTSVAQLKKDFAATGIRG